MLKTSNKVILKIISFFVALTISFISVSTFTPSTATELNRSLDYIKYDCAKKTTSQYTLNSLPYASDNSRLQLPDNRVRDTDRSVVRLSIGGTGFIVGDHLIATAAHCLYDKENSSFVNNLEVQVFMENGTTLNKSDRFKAVSLHIPQYYRDLSIEYMYSCYDYGLIYVEEDLSSYGIFNLGLASDMFLAKKSNVTASGFPADKSSQRYKSEGYMSLFNLQSDIENYITSYYARFFSSCVTYGGDSGGPLYATTTLQGNKYNTVVGIVTGGGKNNDGTFWGAYGIRVTIELLQFYLNNPHIT